MIVATRIIQLRATVCMHFVQVKEAQRFVAGVLSGDRISPRRGRLNVTEPRAVASGIRTHPQSRLSLRALSRKLNSNPARYGSRFRTDPQSPFHECVRSPSVREGNNL